MEEQKKKRKTKMAERRWENHRQRVLIKVGSIIQKGKKSHWVFLFFFFFFFF